MERKEPPSQRDREDECPDCDSSLPAEWDAALRVFHCPCCSATWRPRGRHVPPPPTAPPLPGLFPLTLESEWDT